MSSALSQDNAAACYTVGRNEYCFYTDNYTEFSRDEAREFCAAINSTLPIITNENIHNVFQQFLVNDSYDLIRDKYVWLDARANRVEANDPWQWIDGQPSGLISGRFHRSTPSFRLIFSRVVTLFFCFFWGGGLRCCGLLRLIIDNVFI